MHACIRVGLFPEMMEHLPALDADAIKASIQMVDRAHLYVGLFAHRYGHIPKEHDISITQMEYERAVERGIPRLIFLIDEDAPVRLRDVDKGEKADKLNALKELLKEELVVSFFESPSDLRTKVVDSLHKAKNELEAASGEPDATEQARSLHRQTDIPLPPNPFIAHPYTLSQARGLIGRQNELDTLTDWVTKPNPMIPSASCT